MKSILDPSVKRSAANRRHWAMAAIPVLCAAILFSSLTFGQQPPPGPGDLTGSVADPSGAPMPGATVIATHAGASNREIATTDAAGNFAIRSIPTGTYKIEVRAPGFSVWQQNDVAVTATGPAVVNPMLTLGGINESVAVVAEGMPRRPAPAGNAPLPIRVGGNVQAANLAHKVNPAYPADLQARGIEGTVLLNAVIGKDGAPLSVAVRNSAVNPEFANAALDAVRQWRYQPTLLNGEPVEVATTITIDFRLKQ